MNMSTYAKSKNVVSAMGLRKKPIYMEVVHEILTDPDTITYPNRKALQIRESPWMAHFADLKIMEDNLLQQLQKEQGLRATNEDSTATRQAAERARHTQIRQNNPNIAQPEVPRPAQPTAPTQVPNPTQSTTQTQAPSLPAATQQPGGWLPPGGGLVWGGAQAAGQLVGSAAFYGLSAAGGAAMGLAGGIGGAAWNQMTREAEEDFEPFSFPSWRKSAPEPGYNSDVAAKIAHFNEMARNTQQRNTQFVPGQAGSSGDGPQQSFVGGPYTALPRSRASSRGSRGARSIRSASTHPGSLGGEG
jgi:hypothetical protein